MVSSGELEGVGGGGGVGVTASGCALASSSCAEPKREWMGVVILPAEREKGRCVDLYIAYRRPTSH